MKKIITLLLILSTAVCFSQTPIQFSFFKGDSLHGFDINTCLAQMAQYSLKYNLSKQEQLNYVYAKEKNFINAKYNTYTNAKLITSHSQTVLTTGCTNVDFESGDFTGWLGATGINLNTDSSLSIQTNGISTRGINSLISSSSYHTLVSAGAGKDTYGGFSQLDSAGGGSYAVRLGGDSTNLSSGGEILKQTFVVTSSNALFIYRYAVVMQDGGHPAGQQPYFKAEVLDSNGHAISCLSNMQAFASGPTAGYILSSAGASVYYLPWTNSSFDLSAHIGAKVTVQFTAAGCTNGGHFCYAYIDANCSSKQLTQTLAPQCPPVTPLTTFMAPAGGTYSWTMIPSGSGIVGSTINQWASFNQNGQYRVTVSPSGPGACTYTIDTTIVFPVTPALSSVSSSSTCGNSNGNASVTVSEGTNPFTYLWSNAATSQTITGLAASDYTVTVTDAKGCTQSAVQTVNNASGATVSISGSVNITCNGGNNGSALASASGGTAPFTYSWSNGASTVTVNSLTAGPYTVSVIDANGCSSTANVTITEPTAVRAAISAQSDESCSGANGSASISASGGAGTYIYSWSSIGAGTTLSGASAGVYTVTVTDYKGCSTSLTVTIADTVNGGRINGQVSYSGGALNGTTSGTKAVLYKYASSSKMQRVDSMQLSSGGAFSFANKIPGQYVVWIEADTAVYHSVIPTYYGDSIYWSSATVIYAGCDSVYNINISMTETAAHFGKGTVSGKIVKGLSFAKMTAAGDPISGVDVSIGKKPKPKNLLVAHTQTDANGLYSFGNLPAGDYQVLVDIPGLPMDTTYSPSITTTDTVFTNLNYVADSSSINIDANPTGISTIRQSDGLPIRVYPNPFSKQTKISLNITENSEVQINVYNTLGEKIETIENKKLIAGDYNYTLTISSKGIYFLQTVINGSVSCERLVQVE